MSQYGQTNSLFSFLKLLWKSLLEKLDVSKKLQILSFEKKLL